MTITIAHLYYDLLNLYGENGNLKTLLYHLEGQGVKTKVKLLTIGDELNFKEYDLVYMGTGTEQNQKIALKHLLKYKKDIKEAIERNKFFLITGNAIDLFGKKIVTEEKSLKALEVFPYVVKQEPFRMVDEAIFKTNLIKEDILGFQNQSSTLKDNPYPLFEVVKGVGSYPNSKEEGIIYNNFYGTYLIGPFLTRNPYFLKYFVTKLISAKEPNFKFKKFNLNLDIKAYHTYIQSHYTTLENEK